MKDNTTNLHGDLACVTDSNNYHMNVLECGLAMEMRNGFEPYRKQVPCNVDTDQSAILKKPLSNSVPEIIFCRTNLLVMDR